MSTSQSITSAETIISNHAFFFIEDCALFAEATLIFSEYLITFDSEVQLIWRRKVTGASVLFFLNRYIMLFQNAITIASYWSIPDLVRLNPSMRQCVALGWMDIVLNLLPYFIWNAFSTLRVYALCGREWRLALVVCVLMMGPIVANAYNIPTQKPDNLPPPYNCQVDNAVTVALHTKCVVLVLGSRISLIVGDSLVLAVTWWKTYRLKKAADAAHIKTSLVELLLRDGTIYFGTMLVLNVLHIAINFVEQVSFMGDIADVLTSILVSRFIMNLRDIDGKDIGLDSAHTDGIEGPGAWHAASSSGGHESGLVFASDFVASMGGPLERSDDGVRSETVSVVDREGSIHEGRAGGKDASASDESVTV
ncbi:hypothetical protein C8Q77DRAFT_1228907 [Trametes polyzona]|nr:hypothetical protein C8Q77DRAFT_1228907 [Trametes polyzona]